MKEDAIVEEVRGVGQAYVDSFKGDWGAMLEDLRRRAREEGYESVRMAPKRVERREADVKKAG